MKREVRLHLTNVSGVGATQLAQSLLPAIERSAIVDVPEMHLPASGSLSQYVSLHPNTRTSRYRRYLPYGLSRFLECTVFGLKFRADSPLLVLGDMPISGVRDQTVFVQTPHLLAPDKFHPSLNLKDLKRALFRALFRINLRHVKSIIVQTNVMKDALIRDYPSLANRVSVIPQPVPEWLIETRLFRKARVQSSDRRLSLGYPAFSYAHKNHRLLSGVSRESSDTWPVRQLVLTIEPHLNPSPTVSWIQCVGLLTPKQMISMYERIDALLFLSCAESFGFPLVEAMFVGLPIVCPDLPYARLLCGEQAVYFESNNLSSLKSAVSTLHLMLNDGWWPDWATQLAFIPPDWESVARDMLAVTLAAGPVAS